MNVIIALTLQAMNEGMVLATKAGITPHIMMQVIQSSRARSGIIEMKGPQVLKRDSTPFFSLKLMAKDLGLALDCAPSLSVPLLSTAILKQIYAACMAEGLSEQDFCATVKFMESAVGIEVGSGKTSNQGMPTRFAGTIVVEFRG